MRKLNRLFECTCCARVTRIIRGDVCPSCWGWAENTLVNIIAGSIQAELTHGWHDPCKAQGFEQMADKYDNRGDAALKGR